MTDLKTEIQEIIEETKEVSELFYQQKDSEGYGKLSLVIDKISGIIEKLFLSKVQSGVPDFDQRKLLETLGEAMKAMADRDSVLLGDILQYDLLEQFVQIHDQL